MRPSAFVFAQACAAAIVLARLARGHRRRKPLCAGASPSPPGLISVVVPARDEARRIGPCLEGLRADPDIGEIVVVDDRSTDATAHVARAGGARIVAGQDLPDGWCGKAWALHQGLQAARGEIVVFLDADARPRPGLVRELTTLLDEVDLVTAGPSFRCDSAAERLLHPAMAATIPYRTGPGDALDWQPAPNRAIANGQCIAMRRRRLLDAGGWARVRRNMTDDVALARAARRRRNDGVRRRHRPARGPHVRVRARNVGRLEPLADDARREHAAALGRDLAVLWLAMALPLPRLLARRATALDALLLAVRLALHATLKRSYRPSGVAFWFAPLLDVPVLARLTWSVIRPARSWRGRTYR